jgi:hypothetical protein
MIDLQRETILTFAEVCTHPIVELNRSAVEGFLAVTSVSSRRFLPLRFLASLIIRSCVWFLSPLLRSDL